MMGKEEDEDPNPNEYSFVNSPKTPLASSHLYPL
jgi:hypothetical protein